MVFKPKQTIIAALMAGLGFIGSAYAGLGSLKVLSVSGEAFKAEIPVIDENPQGNVVVVLADRNHYPQISSYSSSVDSLKFSVTKRADGSVDKVIVTGPARFSESLLRFAVEMSWPAGRVVREFEIDPVRDAPQKKPDSGDSDNKKQTVPNDSGNRISHFGVGDLKVNSKLGEPLDAELELSGLKGRGYDNIIISIASLNPSASNQSKLIDSIAYQLVPLPSGAAVLKLKSSIPVSEPLLAFRLNLAIGTAKFQKQYSLMFNASGYAVQEQPAGKQALAMRPVAKGAQAISVQPVLSAPNGSNTTAQATEAPKKQVDIAKQASALPVVNKAEPVSAPVQPLALATHTDAPNKVADVASKAAEVTKPAEMGKPATPVVTNPAIVAPVTAPVSPPAVTTPQVVKKPVPEENTADNFPALSAETTAQLSSLPAVKQAPAAVEHGGKDTKAYTVKRGDTLSEIAERMRDPHGEHRLGRQDKLFEANPHAFVGHNQDKLKAGVKLDVPADWTWAGEKHQAHVGHQTVKQHTAHHAAAHKPTMAEKAAAATDTADAAQATQLKQMLVKQDTVLKQVQQKAVELEHRINTLKEASSPAVVKPVPAKDKVIKPVPVASAPVVPHAVASEPAKQKPVPIPPKHIAKEPVKPKPVASHSVLDEVIKTAKEEKAVLLAGGGAAAVAAAAALVLAHRRKQKKTTADEDVGSSGDNSALPEQSDSTLVNGLNLDNVDLMSEAGLYETYGKHEQALSLLRAGVEKFPRRLDLRHKILEILHKQKDRAAFLAELSQSEALFEKDSPEWQQIEGWQADFAPKETPQPTELPSMADTAVQPAALSDASSLNREEIPIDPASIANAKLEDQPSDYDLPASQLEDSASAESTALDMDMMDVDLSAESAPTPTPAVAPTAEPVQIPPEPAPVATKEANPEVLRSEAEEKRELAKLYMEMGDKETAMALLKEAEEMV